MASKATATPVEELNLDEKVTVRSIAPWATGFTRIADGFGEVNIAPNGSVRLSRNEIISQVQTANKLFCGIDGVGSHATLIIEDKATRIEVDFETKDSEQNVFSDEKIKTLFGYQQQKRFETGFMDAIKTNAEKHAAMQAIKKFGLNDYNKIRFAEKYTGCKIDFL